MTITQNPSTGSADRFTIDRAIYREDVQELVELQNWAIGYRPMQHLALSCSPPGFASGAYGNGVTETWGSTNYEVGTLYMSTTTPSAYDRYIITDIIVSPSAMTGACGAVIESGPGAVTTLDFIFSGSAGLVTSSISHDASLNDTEVLSYVTWSQVRGTTDHRVRLEVWFGIGAFSDSGHVKNLRVFDLPVTSSFEFAARPPATGSIL